MGPGRETDTGREPGRGALQSGWRRPTGACCRDAACRPRTSARVAGRTGERRSSSPIAPWPGLWGMGPCTGDSEVAWVATALSELLTTEMGSTGGLRTLGGHEIARIARDIGYDEGGGSDMLIGRLHQQLRGRRLRGRLRPGCRGVRRRRRQLGHAAGRLPHGLPLGLVRRRGAGYRRAV